jgi:hypothetical protein
MRSQGLLGHTFTIDGKTQEHAGEKMKSDFLNGGGDIRPFIYIQEWHHKKMTDSTWKN